MKKSFQPLRNRRGSVLSRAREQAVGALALILLIWTAVRFAQPIADSDVFWHMSYARQMLERRTLRVDQTIYSWMPSSNDYIYVAWLSELIILALWNALGLVGMALLRYGGILTMDALLAMFARRLGMLRSPLTWTLILLVNLSSLASSQPKSEIFSLVFWNLLLYFYFGFRFAARRGTDPSRWLFAVPILIVVWANSHGGFILAGPFLAITLLAEWAYALFTPAQALARPILYRMTAAWIAAALATVVNPYGYRYLAQLAREYVLRSSPRPDTVWNSAYQPALSYVGAYLHLPELLVLMTVAWMLLLLAAGRRGPVDWTLLALYFAYVPVYLLYLRSTFLLPALFAYSVLWLAGPMLKKPAWTRRAVSTAAVLLFLFWTGRSLRELRVHPETYSWTGFGYSYFLPADEADFLARIHDRLADPARPGPVRLYNMFDSGGYLLWRLYPQFQVMTDSRSFPYLSWFQELYHFSREASFEDFEKFSRSPLRARRHHRPQRAALRVQTDSAF